MDIFSFNNRYLTKNGEPWFPIMGEFHYSRYPSRYWDESLAKIKAGGVNVVSAYTIWIHHEEIENEYDFTGDKTSGFLCNVVQMQVYTCFCVSVHGFMGR